jgi:VIT1/CCC1 family predicted Fe2+/Mn2+ transporter
MVRLAKPREGHAVKHLGWLRAAVLGANDGILSTSSLIIGVASAHGTHQSILIAGVSGLVAGAMSMASGEYVSVSSQSDSERADIAREGRELRDNRAGETRELADIYVRRGLDAALAMTVAEQLMTHDALGAHTRDELGISDMTAARPVQAALASAAAFSAGAAPALLIALAAPPGFEIATVALLVVLGAVGARAGGARMMTAAIRVTFWGALAMAVTAGIGAIFGAHL